MIEGAQMMAHNWWIGGAALMGTTLSLTNRVLPAMFVLLMFGAAYGIWSDPTLVDALRAVNIEPRVPTFALSQSTWNDLVIGAVFLVRPQVPLTLGNAVIAITEKNNRLFPDRPVNEGKISTSTGLINIFSAGVGGVPMCHGAGGTAGHVQFGARTGGAFVVLGAILLLAALFFSGSIGTLLRLFPASPRGDPFLDRCAAGSRLVRFQQGQRRALRYTDYGGARCVERWHRLSRWHDSVRNEQARLAASMMVGLQFRRVPIGGRAGATASRTP